MSPDRRIVVAIDGPSGAGKSTVARAVARRLGILFLDTGAMYRAVALELLRRGVEVSNDAGVADVVRRLQLRFSEDGTRIFSRFDREPEVDVSEEIRMPHVTSIVSQVAAMPSVRSALTQAQRRIADGRSVVAEGRDTTTVVFPDADRKFFLTASLLERARRRKAERPELGAYSLADIAREIQARDEHDSTRVLAPLRRAETSIDVETTGRPLESIVDEITRLCEP